jgi:hypothetical protein
MSRQAGAGRPWLRIMLNARPDVRVVGGAADGVGGCRARLRPAIRVEIAMWADGTRRIVPGG